MSRLFDDASSQSLEVSAAPVTAAPFTMACWFNADDATNNLGLIFIGDDNVDDQHWFMSAQGNVAGDPVRLRVQAMGTTTIGTTTGYTVGTWHHACSVIVSATDRSVFIDGGSEGNSTISRAPAGANMTAVGVRSIDVPTNFMSGNIMEAAIWDVDLTNAEVAILALAYSPLLVRPASLVFYAPIIGRTSPEIEYIQGNNLTVTGATVDVHNRMIYPSAPQTSYAVAADDKGVFQGVYRLPGFLNVSRING